MPNRNRSQGGQCSFEEMQHCSTIDNKSLSKSGVFVKYFLKYMYQWRDISGEHARKTSG